MNVAVVIGDLHKPDPVRPSVAFGALDGPLIERLMRALEELPEHRFTLLCNHDTLVRDLQGLCGRAEIILNLCDAGFNNAFGREMHLPALYETLGFRYTGAGPRCLAYCYDKGLMDGVARQLGIPVPASLLLSPGEGAPEWPFGFPVLVKPNQGHGSIGITFKSLASDPPALVEAIVAVRAVVGPEAYLLVQEFLPGREVDAGILGDPRGDLTLLPLLAKDYSKAGGAFPQIASYELKWLDGFPEYDNIPVDLDPGTERLIRTWSAALFDRLECRDYARIEWRLDGEGAVKLIEVNPNPDWSPEGALAEMAAAAGIAYPEMIRRILRAATQRP